MRLIDADALKKRAVKVIGMDFSRFKAVSTGEINHAPTIDAVPVVRCAGCKHYHAETGYCDKNSHFIDSEGMSCSPAESPNWTIWDENDFCSFGERKES